MNELVLRVCFVATVAAARQVLFFRNIYIRLETYLSSLLIFDIIMGLHKFVACSSLSCTIVPCGNSFSGRDALLSYGWR